MSLLFTEANGAEGRISDDLSVVQLNGGGVAASIESFVETVEADAESVEDAFDRLLIELPSECAVREVRRIRDDG